MSEEEVFEFTEIHRRVFDFVDKVESAEDQGVPVGLVTVAVDLDGVPGFQEVRILEDAFFDLVEQGYFSMPVFAVARISNYPQ